MKIGFLAGTLGRGGAERQLVYMLRALKSEGLQTRVLCLTRGEAFEKEIRDLGIDVDWVGSSANNLVRLVNIVRNLRKHPVDIIQSAHFYTNAYTAVAGRISGTHAIGAIRNDLTSEMAANHIFGTWHLKLPRKLIANSRLAVDRAVSRGIRHENIELVRNVLVGKNGVGKNDPTERTHVKILFVGRLVAQKRPELFIEMAARLTERSIDKNLKFVMAGDGPLRPELEALARKRGLDDCLKFAGEIPETSDLYASSDILVICSEHEGTPNVALEAMGFGLPIVASRVGGVPEVVSDQSGILVDPSNIKQLVAATEKLIGDKELRRKLGIAGQTFVRTNHSIEYLQKRLTGIYLKMLSSPLDGGNSRVGEADRII